MYVKLQNMISIYSTNKIYFQCMLNHPQQFFHNQVIYRRESNPGTSNQPKLFENKETGNISYQLSYKLL